MESDSPLPLPPEDLSLAHALQLDGRAPFRRIAEVLGVSDQTVARRYTRLVASGTLRAIGQVDPLACGETSWMVRVRCTPDAAAALAEALARREETSWVSLISGGTEISLSVRELPQAAASPDNLLLRRLPRTPRVTDVQAHARLHAYFGQEQAPITRTGPLTAEQVAALAPEDGPDGSVLGRTLDERERVLVGVLARDGRAPVAELAEATGWSETTVRRRMSELRRTGALYFDLDLDLELINRGMRAALWLDVPPAGLAAAGRALAAHPEVGFAAATTGEHNLWATVSCRDGTALYRYLTESVAAIPDLTRVITSPIHRTVKGPGPFPPAGRPQSTRPTR
ncbi:AsnC family protein [Mangrovactinospora gilvigrisea]|uniref:AsnC family protein n=1 Tax=Mangrovactinospora gilvigrisea TaxID=1428644 RepID=A0A1J7C8D7_9ACTN|nr:AsnC family transcriptional regulator [Mangrovactinospora gilvigrisea]OIV37792.1 AsnC family protein [Mangrovactinospora gilvigrisea]